ncbi:MAG: haloalkane dehalogenase [Ardenticatenaceae bacterium]|nr:haloalkane dehalogenase [Ardenticatenaceae bacterium]
MKNQSISAEFPFQSHYLDVLDSKIHYVDEGDQTAEHTFVLIHGNPTSSYLWRNIIPHLSPLGRVIALDLIGMGKSGKPDIDYTFKDHIEYVEEFIAKLDLTNIIFVIQDWGSGIGFNYANKNRENVSGIVFFEAILRPIHWHEANFIERFLFKRFRHPQKGYKMIVKKNFFVKRFLPMMAGRKLTKTEMAHYMEPYKTEASRKPVFVWPSQISINGEPKFSTQIKQSYYDYLPNSEVPKLMFHAHPGMIIKKKEAQQIRSTWRNLEAVDLGKGKHYLQEQYPHEIGEGIANWYNKIFKR